MKKIKTLSRFGASKVLTALGIISVSTFASAQQVNENKIFTNGDLEISFETEFHNMWDDRGSGSNRNGGFFRPKLDKFQGFHSLGDMAIGGYDPSGQVIAIARDKSAAQDILVAPTDYVFYYNDGGSGANRDGSMWHAKCPTGYVAMGSLANGPSKPSLDAMRCIKEKYVKEATLSDYIWDDKGSGGDRSMSAWKIKSPGVNSGDGVIYLPANTFLVSSNYSKPNTQAYALILPIDEVLPADDVRPERPVQADLFEPSLFANNGTVSTTYLPWFAVKDNLSLAQRIVQSPTYKLVRETRYRRINFLHNAGSRLAKQTWESSFGTDQSKSSAYTEEVGIEIKGGWTSPVGPSAEVTLSKKFSHTTETASAWNKQETITVDVEVEPNSATAVYLLESTYSLYRLNGTPVGLELDHRPSGSFYITSFVPSTGSSKSQVINRVNIYPTTSKGEFTVNLQDAFVPNQQNITVYDMGGNLILSQEIIANKTHIDIKGNAAGMYLIKVKDGRSVTTKKIILE